MDERIEKVILKIRERMYYYERHRTILLSKDNHDKKLLTKVTYKSDGIREALDVLIKEFGEE